MKKLLLIISITILLLLVGCGSKETFNPDSSGSDIVKKTVSGKSSGDWCPSGDEWNFKGTFPGPTEGTDSTWKIDKIMTSGKYAGLCHVFYSGNVEGNKISIDFYFTEDNTGFWEIDVQGQKIVQPFGN